MAEVKQSNAAQAGVEGCPWSASEISESRDPSVRDPRVSLCLHAAAGTPAGDPGTACRGAGRREGIRRSHALGKFPRTQHVRRFPRVGSQAAHTARGFLREGPRRTRRDTAPKSTVRLADPTLHSKGKIGDPGAPGVGGPGPGFREWRGEARPLPPLSGSRRGPPGRSPEVSAWRRGRQSSWRVMGGPARAADAAAQPAAAQPAAAPQHQQPPQQHQQRTRLSGGRGLHCSPRRRRRAALRAGPRAAWSHAPPAPRALGPAPRPRPASPLFRWAPLLDTRRPKFPLAPSGSGARETARLPGGAQTPGAGRREGRGVDHCPPHHCKGMA